MGFDKPAFDISQANSQPKAMPTQPQQKKKKRGLIGELVSGVVEPFSYLANTTIVNPIKESAAQLTGNRVAYQNAKREANRELGLGESGEDLAGGLKKFAGNTAQVGLTAFAPAAKTIKGAAAIGAGTGAGSALAQEGSTLEDVATGGVLGGLTGGAIKGAGNILGKLTKGSGKISSAAKNLDAEASGVGVGQKIGSRTITPEYETQLQDFLRTGSKKYLDKGVKAGTPRSQAVSAEKVFKNVGNQLDDTLKSINREIGEGDKLTLSTNITNLIDEDAGITAATKTADKFKTKLSKAKDLQALEKIRREADDIAYNSDKAGKTSAARQARHVRDAIDEFITPESAEYKAIKGDYKLAKDALELTTKNAGKAKGIKVPLVDVEVGKQTIPGAKSFMGDMLSRNPELPSIPTDSTGFIGGLTRQAGAAQAGSMAVPGEVEELDVQTPQGEFMEEEFTPDNSIDEYDNPYSATNVQANVQQILAQGGKQKDVAEYLSNVKMMRDLMGTEEEKKKPLNATQRKEANNAISALKDIKNIRSELERDSSGALKASLPGGSFTQRMTGTTGLASSQKNVVDAIARLRSGAAITEDEAKRYMALLPSRFDSVEDASSKLDRLEDLLYSFTYPEGGTDTDIESLLSR